MVGERDAVVGSKDDAEAKLRARVAEEKEKAEGKNGGQYWDDARSEQERGRR